METKIVKIDGKTIMLDVLKPMIFQGYIDVMRKNFEFRDLVKSKELIRDDNKHYLYGLISLLGKNFRIKIAKFRSKEDETLFLNGISKAKEIKQILGEFEDTIIIST